MRSCLRSSLQPSSLPACPQREHPPPQQLLSLVVVVSLSLPFLLCSVLPLCPSPCPNPPFALRPFPASPARQQAVKSTSTCEIAVANLRRWRPRTRFHAALSPCPLSASRSLALSLSLSLSQTDRQQPDISSRLIAMLSPASAIPGLPPAHPTKRLRKKTPQTFIINEMN
ncbi:hypothetical protein Mapa_007728 [Marchantia paleacea]|nr:hypothetical protein Mapa_007728 [Marchantia paleacea]